MIEEKISNIIKKDIERNGIEIVELKCSSYGNRAVIRVLIDKPGGITVGDCSRVSNTVKFLLNGSDLTISNYNLEVSSPGLDRPLTLEKDFLRNKGKAVTINLNSPFENKIYFEGKILNFENNAVTINTGASVIQIPIEKIAIAKLKIDFSGGRQND